MGPGEGGPGEGGHLFSCFTSKIEPAWVSLLSVLEGPYLCFSFKRVPVYVSVPEWNLFIGFIFRRLTVCMFQLKTSVCLCFSARSALSRWRGHVLCPGGMENRCQVWNDGWSWYISVQCEVHDVWFSCPQNVLSVNMSVPVMFIGLSIFTVRCVKSEPALDAVMVRGVGMAQW